MSFPAMEYEEMNLPTCEFHLPQTLFTTTGRDFFTSLHNYFQNQYRTAQLLVVKPVETGIATLEKVVACGFLVSFPLDTLLSGLAPVLEQMIGTCWIWSAANEGCSFKALLATFGAESLFGCRLVDDSGVLIGYLIMLGPPCQATVQLSQQLQWSSWRATGELMRLQKVEPLLRQSELHQAVLNTVPLPIFFKDTEGRYLGCNDAFEKFLGKSSEEIVGQEVYGVSPSDLADTYRQADLELLAKGGAQVYEAAVETASGERQQVIFHKAVFYDDFGNQAGISGTVLDVTQLRAAEDEAHLLAHFDPVTGLPNPTLLRDRLGQELLHALHGQRELAVLCIDLDCFKKINNAYGHEFGDLVLASVAERLRQVLEDEDTVARFGGDSFVVLAQLRPGRRTARDIASSILDAVRQTLLLEARQLFLSASIGIAIYPHDGLDVTSLLSHADAAQAQAKLEGQGDFLFFTSAMNTAVTEQLLLEEHLRRAIDENQFFLLYQPQVDALSRRIVGAEALLRWQHPEWGVIEPDRFIPLAEQTRLIRPLGETVLLQACHQARRWQDEGFDDLRVAVNLSPMQFQDQDLVAKVRRALELTGLDPWRLGLEITETEVMRDFDHAINCLSRFRELGLHLAVDDFGTGYSSLSYLKHFPIDLLKIDRSFISGLPQCSDDAAIVTAIVAMGRGLGLKVMAEGVETAEQERFLIDLDCVAFQGYYYGRPLPAEDFRQLLLTPRAAFG
jgi:diguanylate cyclase (GGDEF)-like protein/PAS domain S-box-containing protein